MSKHIATNTMTDMVLGNARVAGLQKGLNMTDHQYSICVTITYMCVLPLVHYLSNA